MKRAVASIFGLAAAALVVLPVAGDAVRPPVDLTTLVGGEKITVLLDEVVARQRALRSLRAEFVEVRRSALLLEPMWSSGEFTYLAPDLVRWDFRQPEEMVVLFAQDSLTTYRPLERRAERVKVSRRDRRFVRALAGTLPLDDLTSNFQIRLEDPGAPAPYRLRLQPQEGSLVRRLDSLVAEIDRTLLLPVVVEYNEADGDSTRYEFRRLQLDPEVDGSRFQIELGEGVTLHTIDASSGLG